MEASHGSEEEAAAEEGAKENVADDGKLEVTGSDGAGAEGGAADDTGSGATADEVARAEDADGGAATEGVTGAAEDGAGDPELAGGEFPSEPDAPSDTVIFAEPVLPNPSTDKIWYVALVEGSNGRPSALYLS